MSDMMPCVQAVSENRTPISVKLVMLPVLRPAERRPPA